jgi:hypothetical protein
LAHPRLRGGANGWSLIEPQQEALKEYPLETREAKGFRRDPTWRPIFDSEAVIRSDAPRDGRSYFEAAIVEQPGYYWRVNPVSPSEEDRS